MKRLAIVVVGAGAIGRKHVEALRSSGVARLAAIVAPGPEAGVLARDLEVPHLTQFEALDGLEDVAGVILATPTGLHLPQALACIERGWPVLVEKPVAVTAEDGLRLASAAKAAGVPVLVGHHRRHSARVCAARAIIAGGRLGRVICAQASVLLSKPDDYFAPDWRRQSGAGPVLTNLIHEIDTMRHLLGEIVSVQAECSNAVRGFAVEDSATAILRFASGALGTVAVSDAAAAPWSWELTAAENLAYPPTGQSCLTISGTKAALELPNLRLWRHDGPPSWYTPLVREEIEVTDADLLLRQIDHFAAVIRGEVAPLVTACDAAASVAVVDAIRRAARSGCRENLSERTFV